MRLSILAALTRVDEFEFAALRDALEISDSALSKQLSVLSAAEYVLVKKRQVGRRSRTWLSSTETGREALGLHLDALRAIVGEPLELSRDGGG